MSSEIMFERIQENLQVLKMKNTLEILPNYLGRAVKDDLNIIEVLDHLFAEEARGKKQRAYENQVRMSAIPMRKTLEDFDFSFQPSIAKRQIDELATLRFMETAENIVFLGPTGVGYLPMDIQGANLFLQLILSEPRHHFADCRADRAAICAMAVAGAGIGLRIRVCRCDGGEGETRRKSPG